MFLAIFVSCNDGKSKNSTSQAIINSARSQVIVEDATLPDTSHLSLSYLMGKFDPKSHPAFVVIDKAYTSKDGICLRKRAYQSFKEMHAAAQKDDVELVIKSAARNFDYQKGIWERKWTGETKIEGDRDASKVYLDPESRAKAILKYSSMPGTSRHHWGTDIDLNNFENDYFESGQGLKEYNWLRAHARIYGFCQTYTAKGELRPEGYEEEKWHWSYLPIAAPLLEYAKSHLKNEDILGFMGSEAASKIGVKQKYVLGINQGCTH